MIITEWQMYWLTRMDNIHILFSIACTLSIAAFVFFSIIGGCLMVDNEDLRLPIKRILFRWLLPVVLISAFIAVACPTTKEMAAIKIVPLISQNKDVQKIPQKVADLASQWLDELTPKKEKL